MSTEKDVVLRDWELLKDDEQIVRSAATKGKYINTCIKLLSERQEVSIAEARKFFYIHVVLYVHRLLNNCQVFKAEHVLKNIGFDAKNVFFEISKESTDSSLRDYLLDHCKSSYEGYESHLLFLEEEWMVFNRLKYKKELLIEEFQEQQLSEFDLTFFDAFCKLDLGLKNKMVAYVFFKDEGELKSLLLKQSYLMKQNFSIDITLAPHLDKLKVWEYYIAKEKLHDLKLWTNNVTSYNPSAFEETLSLLYQQWQIDLTMFNMIEQRLLHTDAILYGVAKFGCFSSRERENIRKILHRIVTVQSMGDNSEFLKQDSTQNLLLKLLEKKDLIQALDVIESEFMKKVIETGESPLKPEMVTLLAIDQLLEENVTNETVFSVSKCLSEYVLEKKEGEMTDDQRVSSFLEHLFEDTPFELLLTKKIIPHKFQHLQSFLENAFLPEHPVELEYLIKRFLNIDVTEIAQTNFDRENTYIPTFNLVQPVDQDIYPTKLSYLHYVKQGRGIYAAYYFFLEHLRQYSKVTTTHALLAAENVTEVALQNLNDPNLVTHCISFMENIGIDTQKVRALIRCLRSIDQEPFPAAMPLNEVIQAMFENLKATEEIDNHVVDLEAIKLISDNKSLDFKNGICELLSKERSWYKILLISQYMNLTMEELFQIVTKIPIINVRKNLMLAIQYDKTDQFLQRNNRQYRKRRNTYGRQVRVLDLQDQVGSQT